MVRVYLNLEHHGHQKISASNPQTYLWGEVSSEDAVFWWVLTDSVYYVFSSAEYGEKNDAIVWLEAAFLCLSKAFRDVMRVGLSSFLPRLKKSRSIFPRHSACMYVYICICTCVEMQNVYVLIINLELAYSAWVAVKTSPSSEYCAPNACVI